MLFRSLLEASTEWFFDRILYMSHKIKDRPSFALSQFVDSKHIDVAFTVIPDDRGDGWTLYRFNDHPRVDFNLIKGNEGVVFVHKNGFIAKTKAMSQEEAIKLALKGVR